MPNKLTPEPPHYSSEGENHFCLLVFVNPKTKYRSYGIHAAANPPQHFNRCLFSGTWQQCLYIRIAVGTELKKNVYTTLQKEHLQTVFN